MTLTHVEDVASMLASVPGNSAAIRQHYNVCSDRAVTFTGNMRLTVGGCSLNPCDTITDMTNGCRHQTMGITVVGVQLAAPSKQARNISTIGITC